MGNTIFVALYTSLSRAMFSTLRI